MGGVGALSAGIVENARIQIVAERERERNSKPEVQVPSKHDFAIDIRQWQRDFQSGERQHIRQLRILCQRPAVRRRTPVVDHKGLVLRHQHIVA